MFSWNTSYFLINEPAKIGSDFKELAKIGNFKHFRISESYMIILQNEFRFRKSNCFLPK